MRFDRTPRYGPISWTHRKATMAKNKPTREKAKLACKYPLFADQLEVAPALPEQDEILRRQQMADASEKRWRNLTASQWRKGRAEYFACETHVRLQIKAEWLAWRGPANALNFIYIVEKHNGVADARSAAIKERDRLLREKN